MDEFKLIELFNQTLGQPARDAGVLLGPGDDCALLRPRPGDDMAVTTDTLVEGIHFPKTTRADLVGYRAIAVNVSDLAAMGAKPRYVTIALSLPTGDEDWVRRFGEGVAACIDEHGMSVIGGNLSKGELQISVTGIGTLPPNVALRRSGAQKGDDVWMTGRVGASALALARLPSYEFPSLDAMLDRRSQCSVCAFLLPQPPAGIAQRLAAHLHSAIDLSDGLAGDLRHIADASGVRITINASQVPIWSDAERSMAFTSDDSYELVFTAHPDARPEVEAASREEEVSITCIGVVSAGEGIEMVSDDGQLSIGRGYQHFGWEVTT